VSGPGYRNAVAHLKRLFHFRTADGRAKSARFIFSVLICS
jgi:hypothetical protein